MHISSALEAAALPEILWRHKWPELSARYGLPFARGSMQNFDSRGEGPQTVRLSGRVGYKRENYLEWLRRLEAEESTTIKPVKRNSGSSFAKEDKGGSCNA